MTPPELTTALVVVTGLPRSGTSLVMSLLYAGGYPIVSDSLRPPDPDNPHGYFEYTPVKSLMSDHSWLPAHCGKAIKIISPLLPYLPANLPLKVILIERPLAEVLASQAAMLTRAGRSQPSDPALLASAWQKQLTATHALLAHRSYTQLLTLQHRTLLQTPTAEIDRLFSFLPTLQNRADLLRTIDPNLHRQLI